jgi:WXG100 family type VII secretion target
MSATVVNHAALVSLANQMDELSHRAQDVLQRYESAVADAHGAHFKGAAGTANLSTTADVKEAQLKIQHRFQAVNDLLRQGAASYTGSDEDNQSHIASVASSLRFH